MNKLEKYSEHIQNHIISIGIFNYEKCLEFNLKNSISIDNWMVEDKVKKINDENKELRKNIEVLNQNLTKIRIEEQENQKENVDYFKVQLENSNKERSRLVELYKSNLESEVESKTRELKNNIEDLKSKNDYYYKLYVDTNKGKNYEEELYPNILDYNDNYLNSIWNINHVGSVMSEKTDFHFKHKDLNKIILLDTKNNLSTNPVANTENFVRDVTRKETNAIGGIMLANGNICNKKNFEINKINDKFLVYVSKFKRDNIGFIFSLLDLIIEISTQKEEGLDKNVFKKLLVQNYKNEIQNLENLEKNKKSILKNIEEIVKDYNSYFKEDIEMEIKNKEIANSSVRVKEKTKEEIVDFSKLEENRKIVGNRSKYYLQYEEDGDKKIQYFINNYHRGRKIKSLEKKNKNVIIVN